MTDNAASDRATQPAFILVRPQMGENIGAAARAMLNFGLGRMRLVAPRDGWPNPRAVATASGAGRVLDAAGVFADTAAATTDLHYVLATTARPRELTKEVLDPEAAMARAFALSQAGRQVGILFGAERAGLENEEIARADAIVTVPVNPAFASLNLGQSVLLMAYEWGRQSEIGQGRVTGPEISPASHAEIEHLARHFEDELERAGFFFPPEKAGSMKLNLRNMWARLPLASGDVRMLHGMLRQLVRRHGGRGG